MLLAWSSAASPGTAPPPFYRVLHAPGGGAVRALVIGVDKYPNLDEALQLKGAVADADDIYGALKSVGVPEANMQRLRDTEAVRATVVKAMDGLVRDAKSGDLVIISYSGHGMRVGPYKRWDGKNAKGYHSQIVMQGFNPTDPKNGHEVIVDAEMRAWYSRLDAKGVDVLVVMDADYSGGMWRPGSPSNGIKLRVLTATADAKIHDSFVPIPMDEKEASADPDEMPHVTFFAGALEDSTVPKMTGIDPADRAQVRGALSYFVARVIQGNVAADGNGGMSGDVTREQLLRFLGPNVREATDARQLIDYGPHSNDDAVLRQVVFRFDDVGVQKPAPKPDPGYRPSNPQPLPQVEPGRVAVANGLKEKRVALVVGNAAYRHADKLYNPVNDARGMRDALKNLGFDVLFGEDLDHKGLRRAIGQFAGRVEGADVAIVYFAGHGATFGDTPYVVPVDAEFSSLSEMRYELVTVEDLIGELRQVKGVRIAILDACRDDTAERELKRVAKLRGGGEVTRGLGPMRNPNGLILAYATQYLSTAADSAGSGNSPFTAALLKNIATPGLDVKDMFFKVGRDVVEATGGRQRPEISVSFYDQYVLAPAAETARLGTVPVVPRWRSPD
jgi:uncharacterized caspase-like protein